MRVSKYRPRCPVVAITPNEHVLRRLCLYWGLTPYLVEEYETVEDIFEQGSQIVTAIGLAKPGDTVIITAGVPSGISGNTNMLKVQRIP